MRLFKLTPLFMFTVMLLAAFAPFTFGASIETLSVALAVVVASSMVVEHGVSFKRGAFGQLGEVGGTPEEQYKRVAAQLKDVSDNLKTHAESAEKQIKLHQTMSEETKASVDKLLVQQGELNARLQAAEQALADGIDHVPAGVMSLGRHVAESKEFQANADRIARAKGAFSVPIQAAITTTQSDSTDGYPVAPQRLPGVAAAPERRLFVRDLIAPGTTQSNSIEYVRETGFTNNADVVSENPSSAKPESDIKFDMTSAPVATIAHWIHASKQVLSDAGMLQSYIDGRLRYGLKLKEEAQLLKGSGVGLNMNGIYTQATAYANPGVSVAEDSIIDRLRIALLQVQLAEYAADAFVLNPIDWATIELAKDKEGRYIFANPLALSSPVLWGLPVVATTSMDMGDFLTGAFRMGAQVFDREDASVAISTEDRDNFVKNMVTILAEERLALAVYRPEAFVKGDFDITSGA